MNGPLRLLLVAAVLSQAQQPPPPFRSGVEIVRLDVSVLDRDRRPIHGLTAADFSVVVDGTPQPIVAFEEIVMPPRVAPTAAWMRDVAPDVKTNALGEPRLFLIVMDDMRTPSDAYMVNTAKSVAHAIVDELQPSDLAAVVFTKNNRGAQELTSDRALLLAAIETFRGGWIPDERVFSSTMSAGVLRRALEVLSGRPQGRSAIMFISVGGSIADEPDVIRTTDLPGAGVLAETDAQLARQQREARLAEQIGISGLVDQTRIRQIPIYGFGIAGLQADSTAPVSTMTPRELQAPRFTDRSAMLGGEALLALAAASGGRAVVNHNKPAQEVPAVFEENNSYYLIGYRAGYPLDDGRTRRMQVRVNRPHAQVTPSVRMLHPAKSLSRDSAAPPPPPLIRAMSEIVPKSDLRLAVAASPFALLGPRLPGGTAAVLAALRVQRPAPAERTTEQVEALAKVFTPEGKELQGISQRAAVTLRPSDSDAVFDILVPLNLKPGRYNIRYSARSVGLNRIGSVYTDVIVPDFARERLAMSGVLLSGEPMPIAAPPDAFKGIVPVIPTTRREFERRDRVRAFVRVYQGPRAGSSTVQMTARIVDAADRIAAETADTLAASRFTPHNAADFTYELPMASLAPGSYMLSLEARLDKRTTARRDVRFIVR